MSDGGIDVVNLRARGRTPGFTMGPLTFHVDAGASLAVLGVAGAGKSLLLSVLAGLVRKTGTIVRPARVAMVFQRDALDDARSALDNVALAVAACSDKVGRIDASARDVARAALGAVGLAAHVDKLPRSLSGGMKKRVGIARALAVNPDVVLADDPTAGLDPETAREVLALLFARDHRTTVIATQDVDVVLPFAGAVLVLDRGTSSYLGAPSGLSALDATRAFAARQVPA